MPAASLALAGALTGAPLLADVTVSELVFASAEASAGYAPNGPQGERQATFVTEVRPGVGMRLRTSRSSLELTLSPRLYHRLPNFSGVNRPLVLMEAGARHAYAMSQRLDWATQGTAQYGEVDYSNARLITDSPVARPDDEATLQTFDTAGETGFAWRAAHRYVVSLRGVIAHTRPITERGEELFPRTTSFGGDGTQRYELDQTSSVSASASFRYYSINLTRDWIAVPFGLGYRYAANRRTTLEAGAGATLGWQVDSRAQAYPDASFAVERVVYETRLSRLTNRFGAALRATFDPLRGRLYPVASLEGSLASTLGTNWTLSAQAAAYTAVTDDPVDLRGEDTILGASASAGYRISEHLTLDFGARETTRATHLALSPFRFAAGETWVFVRLSFVFSGGSAAGER